VGLDVHLCVDREAAAVFPRGQHMRIVRRQQAAPQGQAQQSLAHAGLNVPGLPQRCVPGRCFSHTAAGQ